LFLRKSAPAIHQYHEWQHNEKPTVLPLHQLDALTKEDGEAVFKAHGQHIPL
jgi:hypothetical protein